MISMPISRDYRSIDLCVGTHGYGEQCQRQVAEAEKELGAFVTAVGRIWGSAVAARAAEHWIKLAEGLSPQSVDSRPNWRQLTVLASSLLAMDSRFHNFSMRGEEMQGEMTDIVVVDDNPALRSVLAEIFSTSEVAKQSIGAISRSRRSSGEPAGRMHQR